MDSDFKCYVKLDEKATLSPPKSVNRKHIWLNMIKLKDIKSEGADLVS